MDAIKRIVELLEDESPRKRIAAAVVLGELKVKDPAVVSRLVQMAKDPVEAFAEAAIEALGEMGAMKALPVLLDSLGRGKEIQRLASRAIAHLGEEALPDIRSRLADATPEVRAALSQLLPAVGGRLSFEMSLEGMRGQPFDAVNRVALSVRQEVKSASPAERKSIRAQVEKFLDKKKTQEDEPALRGGLKVLGYLELPETVDTLLGYLSSRQTTPVRVEAATALRFAMAQGASKKALRKLMDLLEDKDALVARAARDTLTVLKIGPEFSEELAELATSKDVEVALWAISRLGAMGGKIAEKTLVPVARGPERVRAEAAAKAVAVLPGGEALLAEGLADAEEEVGAQVLAEVLNPIASKLSKKQVAMLLKAGTKMLTESLAVARRQLEPVRNADPRAWAETLRDKAEALLKKDSARAEAILGSLTRSPLATPEDRYTHAVLQLTRSPMDPHPKARQRDAALTDFERLVDDNYPLVKTLEKDKRVSDEARYYVGFHFAERPTPEARSVGASLLEGLAGKGRTKLAKSAKNKLALLQLR
ncbi:MAG: HEAT repeat domain-containing protein [Myxococcota bacterium]